ncbi:MAG: hypothetical protein ABMA01_11000 [Chthoniobacteraceae bacterium]
MTPRTRVLIGSAAALLAWMLGYTMGGGLRVGGKGTATSRDEAATHRAAAANSGADSTIAGGKAGTIEEQLASRHGKWTKEKLHASIAAIGREPDIVHAARFTIKLTDQLGPEDFPLALTIIQNKKDELGDEAEIYAMLAMARWADIDPKAFGDYLQEHDKLGRAWIGPSEMDLVLGGWAARDPIGAIGWVKSLKEKEDRERGIKAILITVARRDIDEAIAMAETHAPELLKTDALAGALAEGTDNRDMEKTVRRLAELGYGVNMKSAIQRWTNQNASAAFQWAEELPDEKMRAEALKAAWPQFANAEPKKAAEKLSQAAADSPFVEGTAKALAHRLSEENPAAATRWAATLLQPEAREEAYALLGEFMGEKKPTEGAKWLDGLTPGKDRDVAIAAYVRKASGENPAVANDWALTIGNSERRIQALRGTLGAWFAESPATAIEWLQSSPSISEQDRQAILKGR